MIISVSNVKLKILQELDALNLYAEIMRRLKIDFRKNKNHCTQIVRNMNAIYFRNGLMKNIVSNYRSLLRYVNKYGKFVAKIYIILNFLFTLIGVSIKDPNDFNLIIKIETEMEGAKSLARE